MLICLHCLDVFLFFFYNLLLLNTLLQIPLVAKSGNKEVLYNQISRKSTDCGKFVVTSSHKVVLDKADKNI
jgi:hypothetical protein